MSNDAGYGLRSSNGAASASGVYRMIRFDGNRSNPYLRPDSRQKNRKAGTAPKYHQKRRRYSKFSKKYNDASRHGDTDEHPRKANRLMAFPGERDTKEGYYSNPTITNFSNKIDNDYKNIDINNDNTTLSRNEDNCPSWLTTHMKRDDRSVFGPLIVYDKNGCEYDDDANSYSRKIALFNESLAEDARNASNCQESMGGNDLYRNKGTKHRHLKLNEGAFSGLARMNHGNEPEKQCSTFDGPFPARQNHTRHQNESQSYQGSKYSSREYDNSRDPRKEFHREPRKNFPPSLTDLVDKDTCYLHDRNFDCKEDLGEAFYDYGIAQLDIDDFSPDQIQRLYSDTHHHYDYGFSSPNSLPSIMTRLSYKSSIDLQSRTDSTNSLDSADQLELGSNLERDFEKKINSNSILDSLDDIRDAATKHSRYRATLPYEETPLSYQFTERFGQLSVCNSLPLSVLSRNVSDQNDSYHKPSCLRLTLPNNKYSSYEQTLPNRFNRHLGNVSISNSLSCDVSLVRSGIRKGRHTSGVLPKKHKHRKSYYLDHLIDAHYNFEDYLSNGKYEEDLVRRSRLNKLSNISIGGDHNSIDDKIKFATFLYKKKPQSSRNVAKSDRNPMGKRCRKKWTDLMSPNKNEKCVVRKIPLFKKNEFRKDRYSSSEEFQENGDDFSGYGSNRLIGNRNIDQARDLLETSPLVRSKMGENGHDDDGEICQNFTKFSKFDNGEAGFRYCQKESLNSLNKFMDFSLENLTPKRSNLADCRNNILKNYKLTFDSGQNSIFDQSLSALSTAVSSYSPFYSICDTALRNYGCKLYNSVPNISLASLSQRRIDGFKMISSSVVKDKKETGRNFFDRSSPKMINWTDAKLTARKRKKYHYHQNPDLYHGNALITKFIHSVDNFDIGQYLRNPRDASKLSRVCVTEKDLADTDISKHISCLDLKSDSTKDFVPSLPSHESLKAKDRFIRDETFCLVGDKHLEHTNGIANRLGSRSSLSRRGSSDTDGSNRDKQLDNSGGENYIDPSADFRIRRNSDGYDRSEKSENSETLCSCCDSAKNRTRKGSTIRKSSDFLNSYINDDIDNYSEITSTVSQNSPPKNSYFKGNVKRSKRRSALLEKMSSKGSIPAGTQSNDDSEDNERPNLIGKVLVSILSTMNHSHESNDKDESRGQFDARCPKHRNIPQILKSLSMILVRCIAPKPLLSDHHSQPNHEESSINDECCQYCQLETSLESVSVTFNHNKNLSREIYSSTLLLSVLTSLQVLSALENKSNELSANCNDKASTIKFKQTDCQNDQIDILLKQSDEKSLSRSYYNPKTLSDKNLPLPIGDLLETTLARNNIDMSSPILNLMEKSLTERRLRLDSITTTTITTTTTTSTTLLSLAKKSFPIPDKSRAIPKKTLATTPERSPHNSVTVTGSIIKVSDIVTTTSVKVIDAISNLTDSCQNTDAALITPSSLTGKNNFFNEIKVGSLFGNKGELPDLTFLRQKWLRLKNFEKNGIVEIRSVVTTGPSISFFPDTVCLEDNGYKCPRNIHISDMCSSLKVSDTNNSNIVTVRYADEEAITSKSQCSNLNREFILSKKTQSSDTRHNNVGVFGSKPYTIAEEDEKEIVQLLFEGERKQNHEINFRDEITSPAKYSVKNGHGLDESIKTKKTVSFCADVRSLEIDDYPRASTTVFLEGANECRKGVENEPDLVGIDNDDNNAQKTRFHDVQRCVSRVFSYFGILTFTSQGDTFKGKFRDDLNTGGRPMAQDLLGEIKENYQKLLKLGDNRENPEILEILLKELCPEIVRMLSKAIPPENSASYLNNLGTKLWKFINDQNMGLNSSPAPKIFQNLINALQKHSFDGVPVNASDIEIENETHQFAFVNAFICGLLNLRHLGVWLRTIDRKIGGFLELEESALDLIDLLRYLPFRLYIPSVIHICLRSADQNNLLVSGLGKREKVDDSNATTTSIKYGGKDHLKLPSRIPVLGKGGLHLKLVKSVDSYAKKNNSDTIINNKMASNNIGVDNGINVLHSAPNTPTHAPTSEGDYGAGLRFKNKYENIRRKSNNLDKLSSVGGRTNPAKLNNKGTRVTDKEVNHRLATNKSKEKHPKIDYNNNTKPTPSSLVSKYFPKIILSPTNKSSKKSGVDTPTNVDGNCGKSLKFLTSSKKIIATGDKSKFQQQLTAKAINLPPSPKLSRDKLNAASPSLPTTIMITYNQSSDFSTTLENNGCSSYPNTEVYSPPQNLKMAKNDPTISSIGSKNSFNCRLYETYLPNLTKRIREDLKNRFLKPNVRNVNSEIMAQAIVDKPMESVRTDTSCLNDSSVVAGQNSESVQQEIHYVSRKSTFSINNHNHDNASLNEGEAKLEDLKHNNITYSGKTSSSESGIGSSDAPIPTESV